MIKLQKSIPSSEKELHGIIINNLDCLEKGLKLLEYEKNLPKGIPDILCVDSGNRLVIIEVKLHQDENILFQALRYFGDVNKNRYVLTNAFKEHEIDPSQSPRIILIAEAFSDDIRNLTTLITPDIELYVYQVVNSELGEGIVFIPVSKPKIEETEGYEPPKIDSKYEYLQNLLLKPTIDSVREKIKSINKDIEEYPTYSYIGYRYKGRNIASIRTQRQSFDIGYALLDENGNVVEYSSQRISDPTDDFSESLNKIIASHTTLQKIKG